MDYTGRKLISSVIWVAIASMALAFSSCYPTRNVPQGDYLLVKSKYKITEGKVKTHSIPSYIAQKPNKKIFFYRFYLNAYNFGTRFRDSTWANRLFTQNIGEPPVIFDSTMVDLSGQNIKKHLNNLGYYNSSVAVRIRRWPVLRVASVKYKIEAGKAYTIRKIDYDIPDANLRRFVQADLGNSIIQPGMLFSVKTMENERERIVEELKNTGYYYFTRNQISFDADTNLNSYQVDLKMKIYPVLAKTSTEENRIYLEDKRYTINKIWILMDMLRNELGAEGTDTTVISVTERNNRQYLYHFIHKGPLEIKPHAVISALFFKPGRFYKKSDIMESYKALTALNNFRYVTIQIQDKSDVEAKNGALHAYVALLSKKKYSLSSNSEVKNTGGDLGLQQNVGMQIRNTFRNAELLSLDLHGAMEMQATTNVDYDRKWPFNVYEAGFNAGIQFPRFISPIKSFRGNRYLRPKTRVTLGYNYQKRPDYTRYILNGSFGYTWQPKTFRFYKLRLLEISSVKIYPSVDFQNIIDNYTDPRIIYSFQDHLVLSTNLSYTYNEHRFKALQPFWFYFGAIDVGGMPWNLLPMLSNAGTDSLGQIELFGLPSASFIKFESDARYYVPVGKNLMNAFRVFVGVGIPYGSTVALPFEKSFYIGGANSLRGWTIGTLGPGSFNSNATTFEMTGDIKIELNYELRFPISSSFEGAIYTDIGNIWLLNRSDAMPGGEFHFSSFIPQMAIDFGYGLRYDLEYLIIRLDVAHPIYQPYFQKGSRWTSTSTSGNVLSTLNFAIGYPF
jgi:outer membrane protein assembly factor BamA